ncbi:hypothetical protein ANCCAN_29556 [Ancylostoma caninum]|uniref:Mos1 transposase HTH domain-containing protein n=1 Tax=Ancylostoma caninum TaxID=29170 RepID=A0A368EY62_ANCCA|nr:hypothetical protein ANCCAN_29556 [Ancylostoma caninum]
MTDHKYRLRVCMLYDFKQGKTAAESHCSLCNAFGEDVISERQCRRWFDRFHNGDESLEYEEYQRRRQAVDNNALKEAVESDPCQTTRALAQMYGCDQNTIANHLHPRKTNRQGKWIPHQLSDANKAALV